MPYIIQNSIPVSAVKLFVTRQLIDGQNHLAQIFSYLKMSDNSIVQNPTITLQDDDESTEFTDFYSSHPTTEQIYILVAERLSIGGTYDSTGELP